MNYDDEPELAGYVPREEGPVRHPVTLTVMRVVIALVLPGVVYTIGVQMQTADAACRIVVKSGDPQAVGAIARFQAWGGNGPGWYCYAKAFDGSETMLRALGIIPGLQYQPSGTPA
jgi:hypothetical protein